MIKERESKKHKEADSERLTRQTGYIKGETDQESIQNVKSNVTILSLLLSADALQKVYSVNDKFIIYLFIKLIKYILSTKTVLNNVKEVGWQPSQVNRLKL